MKRLSFHSQVLSNNIPPSKSLPCLIKTGKRRKTVLFYSDEYRWLQYIGVNFKILWLSSLLKEVNTLFPWNFTPLNFSVSIFRASNFRAPCDFAPLWFSRTPKFSKIFNFDPFFPSFLIFLFRKLRGRENLME